MARPLRLEFPGAVWHVTNRGVEQRDIYLDDFDREAFDNLLGKTISRFFWRLPAYTQMTNHFHLVIQTLEPTLSRGMQDLQKKFAERFNRKYDRRGHLFQGRFKAHLIDSERYLLNVARYVALNPVRAGLVTDPADWRWSSCAATAGLAHVPTWLDSSMILDRFDAADPLAARDHYREYLAKPDGASSPWEMLVGGMYLGDERFLRDVQSRLEARQLSREHVRPQRIVRPATPEEVGIALASVDGSGEAPRRTRRLAFAALARSETLARLEVIGEMLGVRATGVSYLAREADRRSSVDDSFRNLLEDARHLIRNCRPQM
jgi:putative transposase